MTVYNDISETVKDNQCSYGSLIGSNVAYQTVAIPITLSDLQCYSHIAIVFKCEFS